MKKIALIALATVLGACSSLVPQKSISGTFQGTLPCADCSKIEAELILNNDNTYSYNTIYYKGKQQQAFKDKGTFTRDKTKNNVVVLDENSGNLKFLVTENYAEICDPNGNVVKNPQFNYKLNKIQ